jgi:hypothetical protein
MEEGQSESVTGMCLGVASQVSSVHISVDSSYLCNILH